MDLKHPGNWQPVGKISTDFGRSDVYECPLCFALTRDPISHAEFHTWTRTDHPYTPRQDQDTDRRVVERHRRAAERER